MVKVYIPQPRNQQGLSYFPVDDVLDIDAAQFARPWVPESLSAVPKDGRTPGSRSEAPPLRISIPKNPHSIYPSQIIRSEISLPPYIADALINQKLAHRDILDSGIETIDENGDLILNFVCTDWPWDGSTLVPFLRLQVSSALINSASKPLKLLINTIIPEGEKHFSMSLQAPWLHGLLIQTDPTARYLIISNKCIRSNVPEALKILFTILNRKMDDHGTSPKPVLVARVAEVAWLLDCVDSVIPWIQMRLSDFSSPKPSVIALQRAYRSGANLRNMSLRPYENILLSFAIGDRKTFLRASLEYVLLTTPQAHTGRVGPSLAIMKMLGADVQTIIDTTLQKLSFILNNTFNTWSAVHATPITPSTAILLGTYVQSVKRSFGTTSFPVKLVLAQTESLATTFKKIREIQLSLTDMWKQMKKMGPNVLLGFADDPGKFFGQEVTLVREEMKGLDLEKYRPGVSQLMDLGQLLFRILPT